MADASLKSRRRFIAEATGRQDTNLVAWQVVGGDSGIFKQFAGGCQCGQLFFVDLAQVLRWNFKTVTGEAMVYTPEAFPGVGENRYLHQSVDKRVL